MRVKPAAVAVFFLLASLATSCYMAPAVWGWSNGGYSAVPADPDYGTHDWIAQHAMDWLPTREKQFLIDNFASYLYGTELPDNGGTLDGVGDTTRHHVYFYANGSLLDDSSAVRAREEYLNAQGSFRSGNLSSVSEHLGMVAHYVADMAVFGHVMGASTAWGAENHHSDYEEYVLARTENYGSEFASYLRFDGSLAVISAYDAAVAVARDSTFDGSAGLTCTWMDQHYNWTNSEFKSRCGESLNDATNAVADVLHAFYVETVAQLPTSTPQIPEFPGELATSFSAVTLVLVCLTVFYRKRGAKS